jgi:hypothetical protein
LLRWIRLSIPTVKVDKALTAPGDRVYNGSMSMRWSWEGFEPTQYYGPNPFVIDDARKRLIEAIEKVIERGMYEACQHPKGILKTLSGYAICPRCGLIEQNSRRPQIHMQN